MPMLLRRFALPRRSVQFREIDVVEAPECTRTEVAIILCHGRPDTVPSKLLCEFQSKGVVFDVPSAIHRLGPLMGGVLQLDQACVGDG